MIACVLSLHFLLLVVPSKPLAPPTTTRTSGKIVVPTRTAMAATTASDADPSNKVNGGDTVAQDWDADRYQKQHSFVYEYGSSLLQVLDPKPGERILDLGCGTGELTNEILASISHDCDKKATSTVIGMDADSQMIARAHSQFPHCKFLVGDARSFVLDEEPTLDAIFSNAALHWVPEAERAAHAMVRALKPGGRLVVEMGGKGNIERIAGFLDRTMGASNNPWYFPSVAEYSSLLEDCGMEVTFAQLFDRPTALDGKDGLRNWINMFGNAYFGYPSMTDKRRETILAQAEQELRAELFDGEQWLADYRRLRIVATKL